MTLQARYILALALLALIALASIEARAAAFCVDSAAGFAAALAAAEDNGEDNDIRLRTGLYLAPDGGFRIDLRDGSHSLSIVGGYTNGACTERTHAAAETVLDGRGVVRPLTIDTSTSFGNADATHRIAVSGLFFTGGHDALVSALKISDSGPIYGGIIVVEDNVFADNATETGVLEGGPALLAATDGPDFAGGTGTFVRNNLFIRNTGPNAPAAFVYSNNRVAVTNNTFVANAAMDATLDERVVFATFTFSGVDFANNIFSDNVSAFDLRATNMTDLVDNALVAIVGAPRSETGTLKGDPHFIDAANGNYRLAAGSPLIDAGTDTPVGGLAPFDIDGVIRLRGAHVDIGAFESTPSGDALFADDFDA
jgi:hypothetical protein